MIQPTYYTTPPLQTLPVTAHDQQFLLAQQIPAWPTTYIPSSTVPLPPAASYPQSFSLPLVHAGNQTVSVPSAYIPPSQLTSLPIPVQLWQQILQGEYVDFAMLLHRAKFSEISEVPVSLYKPPEIKRITYFDAWMQAWNLYLAVILAHNPSQAVELTQEIFSEETGSIIDRITPLTSLFLGSMELRLSSNIDSVIYPLWDKSFTEI